MPTGLAGKGGIDAPFLAAARLASVGGTFTVEPGEESSSKSAAVAIAVLLSCTGSVTTGSPAVKLAGTDCDTEGGTNVSSKPSVALLPGLVLAGTCHSACNFEDSAGNSRGALPRRPRRIGEISLPPETDAIAEPC